MTSIRVLLAGMPRMLADIVKDIVATHEDINVIGEIASQDDLSHAAEETHADVIVLGKAGPNGNGHGDYRELLYTRPRLKILAITADGRRGVLHELQPRALSLGEVSPDSLIDAIRGEAQLNQVPR